MYRFACEMYPHLSLVSFMHSTSGLAVNIAMDYEIMGKNLGVIIHDLGVFKS